jgi:hypothetical protein
MGEYLSRLLAVFRNRTRASLIAVYSVPENSLSETRFLASRVACSSGLVVRSMAVFITTNGCGSGIEASSRNPGRHFDAERATLCLSNRHQLERPLQRGESDPGDVVSLAGARIRHPR